VNRIPVLQLRGHHLWWVKDLHIKLIPCQSLERDTSTHPRGEGLFLHVSSSQDGVQYSQNSNADDDPLSSRHYRLDAGTFGNRCVHRKVKTPGTVAQNMIYGPLFVFSPTIARILLPLSSTERPSNARTLLPLSLRIKCNVIVQLSHLLRNLISIIPSTLGLINLQTKHLQLQFQNFVLDLPILQCRCVGASGFRGGNLIVETAGIGLGGFCC
jgi:hypothetical protein